MGFQPWVPSNPPSIGPLTPLSGQVNGIGNNLLVAPTVGFALRIYYVAYNPLAAVEAFCRFGPFGTAWLRNNIVGNAVIAKDFGDLRYLEGAIGEALYLNLSGAVATNWNCFYVEV